VDTLEQQAEQVGNQMVSNNQAFTDTNALQMRLDTTKILEDLRIYLSGYMLDYYMEDGVTMSRKIRVGDPKANDKGIQSIMNYAIMLFNSQTVQGNLDREQYERFIGEVHLDLSKDLVLNRYKWGIDESDIYGIINTFVSSLQLFITRPIGNKERESFQNWMRTIESSQVKEKDVGLGLFNLGKKN